MKYSIFSVLFVFVISFYAINSFAADTIEFDVSKLIFEENTTDKDIGVQLKLDGEPWDNIKLFNPDGKLLADIKSKGDLMSLGLTEDFFETDEPTYQDQDGEEADTTIEEYLDMFPEGEYELEGRTVEGDKIVGTAVLSHILPCGPIVSIMDTDPDNTVIGWAPVTNEIDHETGDCKVDASDDINIVGYEVIVEVDEMPLLGVFDVIVPGTETQVTISPEFVEPGTEYKYEVIAIQGNDGEFGNQSITEGTFETDE